MDKFEMQFEDVDVHSTYMEDKVASATAISTPADEVTNLLRQMADTQHLALKEDLYAPPAASPAQKQASALDERLARLRSAN